MLVVTSRDPGAPPVEYLKRSGGIFRDMLIHDFDVFRWILDDDAATLYATGSVLTDPGGGERGRRRFDGGDDPHRSTAGCAQINTIRRAAYGYDQRFEVLGSKGMLQAGNHKPTEVVGWNAARVSAGQARAFLPRTLSRRLRATRWRISSRRSRTGKPMTHVDRRRREGARTRRGRDHVVAREAYRGALSMGPDPFRRKGIAIVRMAGTQS